MPPFADKRVLISHSVDENIFNRIAMLSRPVRNLEGWVADQPGRRYRIRNHSVRQE